MTDAPPDQVPAEGQEMAPANEAGAPEAVAQQPEQVP